MNEPLKGGTSEELLKEIDDILFEYNVKIHPLTLTKIAEVLMKYHEKQKSAVEWLKEKGKERNKENKYQIKCLCGKAYYVLCEDDFKEAFPDLYDKEDEDG